MDVLERDIFFLDYCKVKSSRMVWSFVAIP